MTVWFYEPVRRIGKRLAEDLPRAKLCLECGGKLARVAERAVTFPYPWVPNGWICTKCNAMFMGVN